MFPIDGITKAEVVEHYRRTAPLMLPHLQDRLLILERFPAGIGGKGFVQQDISRSRPPAWLSRAPAQRSDGWTVEHAVAEHPEDLEWLANQNAITPHRWLSRISHPHRPDLMVIDLDPPDSDFALVRDTARDLRDVLIDTGLVPYAQLTGSRGVHVVVPVTPAADFDIVRDFARQVAQTVVAEDPRHRTLTTRRSARGGRLYLDVMRNGYAQTSGAGPAPTPRWPRRSSGTSSTPPV
jgi:bifunctional non-homologous end joining protein LigD